MRRLLVFLASCLLAIEASSNARASRPPGWDDATHGRDAVPDYDRVFAADRVNRLDITVSAGDWAAVMADMTDMAGPFRRRAAAADPRRRIWRFPAASPRRSPPVAARPSAIPVRSAR